MHTDQKKQFCLCLICVYLCQSVVPNSVVPLFEFDGYLPSLNLVPKKLSKSPTASTFKIVVSRS
jgi:hypothetical protein